MSDFISAVSAGVRKWIALPLAVSLGGTGQSSYSDGQILIGNAAGGLTKNTIAIVANQTTITNGDGAITIGTVQDIGTVSSPQFTKLGLGIAATTALDIANSANSAPATSGTTQTGGVVRIRSAGATTLDIGMNAGAGAAWLQAVSSADLSLNRVLQLNPNGGNVVVGAGLMTVGSGFVRINGVAIDNANSRVGIGVANPAYPLVVQATGAQAPALNIARANGGTGNGEWWGFGIDNPTQTDAMFFAFSSSNYTVSGGTTPWVTNSTPYLAYPANAQFMMGPNGSGSVPVIVLGTTRFVGFGVTTPLKPIHLAVSGQCDMLFNETSQGTDLKNWAISNRSQTFNIGTQNDAVNSFSAKITISRAGLITLIDAANIAVGTTTGTSLGTGVTQKLSVYGVTPIAQRSGASQVAVATTSATQTTPWGFSTQAQADGIVTLVNEVRASLVAFGMIKGAA